MASGTLALLFDDYTLRVVALGAAVLGIVSGALGTFAVLRRQALLGDAISHAALPGIAIGYLAAGTKASLALMVGAALAGFLGTLVVMWIVRSSRVKQDAALGIVLAVFFGIGLVLLTFIQRRPDASQAGLDRFLFGQAATLLREDVIAMALVGGLALLVMLAVWKQLKLLAFDPDYGTTLGLRMRAVDVLFTGLLVVAIVIGLQTVGVVLMSAMVVAPAAAARQWTNRLGTMVVLAAGFGALAGVTGAVASAEADRLPTGPTIVLVVTVIVSVSLLFAPRRGLVPAAVRRKLVRRRLGLYAVLADLAALERQHPGEPRGHSAAVIGVMEEVDAGGVLEELERRGLVAREDDDSWLLTDRGREAVAHP
jgi:manganese/zinc/iron transport system permease protein